MLCLSTRLSTAAACSCSAHTPLGIPRCISPQQQWRNAGILAASDSCGLPVSRLTSCLQSVCCSCACVLICPLSCWTRWPQAADLAHRAGPKVLTRSITPVRYPSASFTGGITARPRTHSQSVSLSVVLLLWQRRCHQQIQDPLGDEVARPSHPGWAVSSVEGRQGEPGDLRQRP